MSFFKNKKNLYPLISLLSSVEILVCALILAKNYSCSIFLVVTILWLLLFGCYKAIARVLPLFLIIGGIFSLIAYFVYNKNLDSALTMANRFGAVFVALIPGMSVETVRMTRNLSQLRVPRAITLGMLITMSFVPVLKKEIKRVYEAMKTRGAVSFFNPKIFYRAFLIPLVTRMVDISDELALSVETRGFTLNNCDYTVYKKEYFNYQDLIYILGLTVFAVVFGVLL